MLCKLFALLDLLLEGTMFIYELVRLNHFERENVDVVVRYTEEQRRVVYAKKYLSIGTVSNSLIITGVLALYLALPSKECNES